MSEAAPLIGLLLAGGKSRRMGVDKAGIQTPEGPLWLRTWNLLNAACPDAYVSIRPKQLLPEYDGQAPLIEDSFPDAGPLAGILTLFEKMPDAAIMVLACDLPMLDFETLKDLVEARRPDFLATGYSSNFDALPEPLCCIYEPAAAQHLRDRVAQDRLCPRKYLIEQADQILMLKLANANALENANTPEDLTRIQNMTTLK